MALQTLYEPLCSEMRSRPLVILDLNGNLLISTHKRCAGAAREDARANAKYLYFRPGLREFMAFVQKHFRVAIWTSNMEHNARATVAAIEKYIETPVHLEFLWSRQHCTLVNEASNAYATRKDLDKVFTMMRDDNVCPRNVTIVDDTLAKLTCSSPQPNTYYVVSSYTTPNAADTGLLDVQEFLSDAYLRQRRRK